MTDRTRLAYDGEERPLADDEGGEDHLRRVFGSKLEFSASAKLSAGKK